MSCKNVERLNCESWRWINDLISVVINSTHLKLTEDMRPGHQSACLAVVSSIFELRRSTTLDRAGLERSDYPVLVDVPGMTYSMGVERFSGLRSAG